MMKKTEEIVWKDPLQMVATQRYHNTSNNELKGFESSRPCCFVSDRGSGWE